MNPVILAETTQQQPSCDESAESSPDVEVLRARILELEETIAQREALVDRMTRECEEFERYFPEASLRQVPLEVWSRVQAGIPLAAAYALYERGVRNQRLAAREQNARNEAYLPSAPAPAESRYFSPAQVRAMSRREVRENYDRIFESMRHWQ